MPTAPTAGLMPETKTRSAWAWEFARYLGNQLAVGELTVTEFVGKRVKREIVDVYDIDTTYTGIDGVTGFVLLKTRHDGDSDTKKGQKSAERVGLVYECRIGSGELHACSCTGGLTEFARPGSSACLHVLACRELLASGEFQDGQSYPHPLDWDANTTAAVRAGAVGEDGGEWAERDDEPGDCWWAAATGGQLVSEFGGA